MQKDSLGIRDFLNSAKEYTTETFKDTDINELFTNITKGNFNTSSIKNKIINIFTKEALEISKIMIDILIVIIVHSILNAIIEDLGNNNVAKIAYFVQYLIIATLIVNVSRQIIDLTKESIENIVNFMNLLLINSRKI